MKLASTDTRAPKTERSTRPSIRNGRELGLMAGGLAVMAVAALPVLSENASTIETALFRAANKLPEGPYPVVWGIMQLGNLFAAPVVAVIAVSARRIRLGAELLLAGPLAWVLAKGVKLLFARGRPPDLLQDVLVRGETVVGHGFVSGHTAVAVALATIAVPYLGPRGKAVVWTLAGAVAVSRMYVGAHFPLDVMGGAGLGIAIGAGLRWLLSSPRR